MLSENAKSILISLQFIVIAFLFLILPSKLWFKILPIRRLYTVKQLNLQVLLYVCPLGRHTLIQF